MDRDKTPDNYIAVHVVALRDPDGRRVNVPPGQALPAWVQAATLAELAVLGSVAQQPGAAAEVIAGDAVPRTGDNTIEQYPAGGVASAGTHTTAAVEDAAETRVSEDGASDQAAPDAAAHDVPDAGAAEGAQNAATIKGKARTTRGRASA